MQNGGGLFGMTGWQALFFWMGLPAMILGVVAYFYLSDRPNQASWLTDGEKKLIASEVLAGGGGGIQSKSAGLPVVLRDRRVYVAALTYFTVVSTLTMFTVWAPTIVRSLGAKSMTQVGLVTAIPYLAGMVGLYLLGKSSDHRLERRWHFIVAAFVAGLGIFALYFFQGRPVLGVVCLCITAFSLFGAFGVFFAIPASFLRPQERASGLAVITTIGNLAGFVMPWASGAIQTATGNVYMGMVMFGFMSIAGAILLTVCLRKPSAE
jgi:sugar phosphate permease